MSGQVRSKLEAVISQRTCAQGLLGRGKVGGGRGGGRKGGGGRGKAEEAEDEKEDKEKEEQLPTEGSEGATVERGEPAEQRLMGLNTVGNYVKSNHTRI